MTDEFVILCARGTLDNKIILDEDGGGTPSFQEERGRDRGPQLYFPFRYCGIVQKFNIFHTFYCF